MQDEKRYQEIVFAIEAYSWNCTKEEAREAMWKDIAKQLQLLIKNDYIAVVYDDDTDIIVIQYEHNEKHEGWGVSNPYWLTEEEYFKATAELDDKYNTVDPSINL